MERYFLYGCGGIGCELADYLSSRERADIIFIDDNDSLKTVYGFPVLSLREALDRYPLPEVGVTVTVGEPAVREAISARLGELCVPEKTIDLSAYHSTSTVTIAPGTILHISSVMTVRTEIGRSCLINKGAVIGHDCRIGDHCVISPNVTVGGGVVIGSGCFIGSGAVIRNNVTIGAETIIGMGAVVTKDVESEVVLVGNPGRVLRKNETRRVF